MKNKPVLLQMPALLGLAVYLVLFWATRLPTLEGVTGNVFRRIEFFAWVLLPDDLLAQWCGTPPDFALADRLPVLAMAGVILAYAASLGWLVMALVRAERGLTRLETFVFSTAVGLNVVSTYVLLVGLLGLLDNLPVFVVPAVLTLAAAGWVWFRRRAESSRENSKPAKPGKTEGRSSARGGAGGDHWIRPSWLWLGAPFVLVILLGGMLPPIEFDVREYHLQVPKESFQEGRIGFLPHNVYGNMPMGTEMLSLLAMVIADDWWLGALAGKTVIAAFAPLTALGLLAAGRRFFSPAAGMIAAIAYISIPWIVRVSNLGLVEGVLACHLFLAVYGALLWRETARERKRSWPLLALSGYLAGAAVSCKYPAVLFVVFPLAVWVFLGMGRDKEATRFSTVRFSRLGWRASGIFLLAAVVGCGTWFCKNWALTGNPTYPLLYEVFGDNTNTWTPEKNEQWNKVHRPHDFSPGTLVKDAVRVGLTSEWLSPVVIPLAALAFMVRAKRRLSLGLLAYFGYMIATWWLFTHRIDRFWIPVLPLVALLAGAGACWSRERIWQWALIGLLLFGSVFNFLVATSGPGGYNRYFVGLKRLRSHPERLDAWHKYFNTHAADGRVLMVGEAEVFDLEVRVEYSTCFDDCLFEELVKDPATGRLRPPQEIRGSFQTRGISHVYVHWGEIDRYRSPGNYGFPDFVQPDVFDRLVALGVLEPWPKDPPPEIRADPWRGYRVLTAGRL